MPAQILCGSAQHRVLELIFFPLWCCFGKESGVFSHFKGKDYRKISHLRILCMFYTCIYKYVEAETPILWPPDAKSWLIKKDPDAGKDWRQEEKGTTEDEMAGWHHGIDGHGFGWTPVVGDGQGGLACRGPWGRKESDTTERLDWTERFVC